jgi:hypothetical protein
LIGDVHLKLTEALQYVGIVALTIWVFYEVGGIISLPPSNKLDLALIGGSMATVVVLFYLLRNFVSENIVLAVGAAIPVVLLSTVGYLVTQYSWLWLVIFLAGFPIYVWFASSFFRDVYETLYSLENIYHGEGYVPTEEEMIAGFKGLVYLLFCAAIATAVYKLFVYLFIGT